MNPFHLKARVLNCIYHFDGETWTREEEAGEDENATWVSNSILEDLNSKDAKQGMFSCIPRIEHAKSMLTFAIGPNDWQILEASGDDSREDFGEEDPEGPSFDVPPEWKADTDQE